MPKVHKDEYGLNPKERQVLDLYLTTCNYKIKDAYRMVYTKANENTVGCNAYKLLNKPESKAYVEMRREQEYQSLCLDAGRVNTMLLDLAEHTEKDADKIKALSQLSRNLGAERINLDANAKIEQVVFEGEDDIQD